MQTSYTRKTLRQVGMAAMLLLAGISSSYAQTPEQVVNQYLASLAAGDTAQILQLIDDPLKRRSSQISSAGYGEILRNHYQDAVTVIESVDTVGEDREIRVRFDFPDSPSQTFTYVTRLIGGEWKIINELTDEPMF